MVIAAQCDEVARNSGAAIEPMRDVVDIEVVLAVARGVLAMLVTVFDESTGALRNDAAGSSDIDSVATCCPNRLNDAVACDVLGKAVGEAWALMKEGPFGVEMNEGAKPIAARHTGDGGE